MTQKSEIYTDGSYATLSGGTWHMEDSPHKAEAVLWILQKHGILPRTVCEVGCGAGGILAHMQSHLPDEVEFTGYEVSPQAHQMSSQFVNERLQFRLGDAFSDGRTYDLALCMDVFEHVEDDFGFIRKVGEKGTYKAYHIPLDVNCSTLLRGQNNFDAIGHLHIYTIETALKTIEYCGQEIVEWRLMGGQLKPGGFKRNAANLVRRVFGLLPKQRAANLMGGYTLLVLAK